MAHLLDAYARTAGLRIDKMQLFEHFFPLPVEGDYVVFVTSAGHAVRYYSFYREVLWLLKDVLKERGITTVQCGLKDDPKIGCDVDVCGLTDQNQFFYVLSGAKLLVSGDTSAMHIAGHYDVPFVALFSTSHPNNSGSYFGDKERQVYLKPEFEGYTPSHNPGEFPKTIDKISPERVANAAANLLGVESRKIESINLGSKFGTYSIDVVPDHNFARGSLDGVLLNIRYDLGGEERIVYSFLQQRKCLVVTKKAMNVDLLRQLKNNLENVVYEVDDNYDLKFIADLRKHGIPYTLMTDFSKEKVNDLKEVFMDYGLVQKREVKTKENLAAADQVSETTRFRTAKFLISQGRIFMSRAHMEADTAIESFESNEGQVIDDPLFWREQEFFFIFNDSQPQLTFPNYPIIPTSDVRFAE